MSDRAGKLLRWHMIASSEELMEIKNYEEGRNEGGDFKTRLLSEHSSFGNELRAYCKDVSHRLATRSSLWGGRVFYFSTLYIGYSRLRPRAWIIAISHHRYSESLGLRRFPNFSRRCGRLVHMPMSGCALLLVSHRDTHDDERHHSEQGEPRHDHSPCHLHCPHLLPIVSLICF